MTDPNQKTRGPAGNVAVVPFPPTRHRAGGPRAQDGQRGSPAPGCEQAVTVLEVLVLAGLILCGVGAAHFLSVDSGSMKGLVPATLQETGAALEVVGGVHGIAASDTSVAGIPVRFPEQNPRALGGCLFTISTLVGDRGGIDMDQAMVTWITGNRTVALPPTSARPVDGPSWTIASRSHFIPYHAADGDRILEPNERFDLLIMAPEPLPPRSAITLVITSREGGYPLTVQRTVPARITPVMDLDG